MIQSRYTDNIWVHANSLSSWQTNRQRDEQMLPFDPASFLRVPKWWGFFFFAAYPSPFPTDCLLIRLTLQTSILDLLQTPQNSWNIVREIVHLLWSYGQEGHSLQKSDLKKWNGSTFYKVFLGLMKKRKASRYFCFTLTIRYCLHCFASCQLIISTFACTTTFLRSDFGWRIIRTKEPLHLPFRILYIRLQRLLVHLRFHHKLTGKLTRSGSLIQVYRQPDWAHSVQT